MVMSGRGGDLELRGTVAGAMNRIYRAGLTTASGGNVSVRGEGGEVWISAAGGDKGHVDAGEVVRVGADGSSRGPGRPSSELAVHTAVYEARPDLRALVHAHPRGLVTFAVCRRRPDLAALAPAHARCGPVALAPYALAGTEALGRAVARAFAGEASCAILENHGVVVGGDDLEQALQRLELLERAAEILIRAAALGPARRLSASQLALYRNRPAPANVQPSGPGSGRAEAASEREMLAAFVRRGHERGYLTGGAGDVSVRLGRGSLLISPAGSDRATLRGEALVAVTRGGAEGPGAAAVLHRAIYETHPGANAVIDAMPVNATAFSMSGEPFPTPATAESLIALGEVPTIAFPQACGDPAAAAAALAAARPAALLANMGVLVAGRSLLEAFQRLEVLEHAAAVLIDARSFGRPRCPFRFPVSR